MALNTKEIHKNKHCTLESYRKLITQFFKFLYAEVIAAL